MDAEENILPQFPLSLVAFPGEKLNLHIFEDRYKQLVNDCWANGTHFGIPPFHNGQLIFFGTEMKVVSMSKVYEDGKMDIKTEGVRVYQIHNFEKIHHPKLYAAASVSYLTDDEQSDPREINKLLELLEKVFDLLNIDLPISRFRDDFTSYKISHHVGLSMEEKIRLLTIRAESQRLKFIENHLIKFIPALEKAEELKERASLNGHFKNLKSPEF